MLPLEDAHRSKVCVRVFIGMSLCATMRACESLCLYTVFEKVGESRVVTVGPDMYVNVGKVHTPQVVAVSF